MSVHGSDGYHSVSVRCVNNLTLDKYPSVWYIITMRTMSEEQRKEEQRKVENRVRRWNESVQKVKDLQKNWKKV